MTGDNHTIRLLTEMRKDIADALSETRKEMRDGFEEAHAERGELRQQMSELRAHVGESETRLATELLAVSGAIQEAKGLIMQQGAIKFVVQDHERRISKLESK